MVIQTAPITLPDAIHYTLHGQMQYVTRPDATRYTARCNTLHGQMQYRSNPLKQTLFRHYTFKVQPLHFQNATITLSKCNHYTFKVQYIARTKTMFLGPMDLCRRPCIATNADALAFPMQTPLAFILTPGVGPLHSKLLNL